LILTQSFLRAEITASSVYFCDTGFVGTEGH
jgi:hypothetical protein